MFGNNKSNKTPIRDRVISVIDEKISSVEEDYKTECEVLEEKLEDDKKNLLEKKVNEIVSKFV